MCVCLIFGAGILLMGNQSKGHLLRQIQIYTGGSQRGILQYGCERKLDGHQTHKMVTFMRNTPPMLSLGFPPSFTNNGTNINTILYLTSFITETGSLPCFYWGVTPRVLFQRYGISGDPHWTFMTRPASLAIHLPSSEQRSRIDRTSSVSHHPQHLPPRAPLELPGEPFLPY